MRGLAEERGEVTRPQAVRRRRSLLAPAIVLMVLAALVVFTVTEPRLVKLPSAAATPSGFPPPVAPAGAGALPPGQVQSLPLVVRDLPDPRSQEAVRAYDNATLLEPAGALEMFVL